MGLNPDTDPRVERILAEHEAEVERLTRQTDRRLAEVRRQQEAEAAAERERLPEP